MSNWKTDRKQPGETSEQRRQRMRRKCEALRRQYGEDRETTQADIDVANRVRWGLSGKPPDALEAQAEPEEPEAPESRPGARQKPFRPSR